MTREVLLVFYGNERFHPPVEIALAEAAGVDDAAPGDRAGESAHHHEPDITASPTVDYGTPPVPPAAGRSPRGQAASWSRRSSCSRSSRSSAACSTCPFTEARVPDPLPRPGVRGRSPRPSPPASGPRSGSTSSRSRSRIVGIFISWRIYRGGLEDPAVDPLDRRLGGLGRLFGHAWYYDEGIAAAVGGPIRRGAQWLADVFDQKIIDGAVNGIARGFGAAGTQVRKLQTGLVRQYALAHRGRHRRVADLGRDPGGDVGVGNYPILTAIIVTPLLGALAGAAHAGAPARDRPRGRRSSRRSRRWASRCCCSGSSRPASAASSSSSRNRWFDSLGVGYIVGVDGFSLFMVVDHRGAVPDRSARVDAAASSTASRRTRSGSSCSRPRSWGSSSPWTWSRSSCSGRRCSSRCTSSSRDGAARTAGTRR